MGEKPLDDRVEKVRTALAMQDAGYHAPFDYRDIAALLRAYDEMVKSLRAAQRDMQEVGG